jgi:hypothetical protein
MMQGFTDNYLKIETPCHPDLIGRLLPVTVGSGQFSVGSFQ